MIWALIGSRWMLYAVALLGIAGVYEGWKYHQRSIGASKLEAKIEKKADENVKKADAAGDAASSGAGRVRNPYQRAD